MKLALVTIVTANLEPMRAFYQAVLRSSPRYIVATMLHLPWRLAPSPCGASPNVRCGPRLPGAANDRVLIELEVADVAQEYARLKGLEVEWVHELTTQPWGHRAFYVRDPDGNVLNFHTAVEEQRC